MRLFPAGVCVVGANATVTGSRVDRRLARLALARPAAGRQLDRPQPRLHEVLRSAGAFGVSILRGDQADIAEPFARGTRRRLVARRVQTGRGDGRPLSPTRSRWIECRMWAEYEAGDHTFFVGEVVALEEGENGPGTRLRGHGYVPSRPAVAVYEKSSLDSRVVFDLDGVLVDSERLWDEVREQLARERGGRWHDRAQADMMGMSSTEWSRYMHDVIGLAESPGGDQRRGRAAPARALPGIATALAARRRGCRAPGRRWPLGLASSSNPR